jgi:hypothetical protein
MMRLLKHMRRGNIVNKVLHAGMTHPGECRLLCSARPLLWRVVRYAVVIISNNEHDTSPLCELIYDKLYIILNDFSS